MLIDSVKLQAQQFQSQLQCQHLNIFFSFLLYFNQSDKHIPCILYSGFASATINTLRTQCQTLYFRCFVLLPMLTAPNVYVYEHWACIRAYDCLCLYRHTRTRLECFQRKHFFHSMVHSWVKFIRMILLWYVEWIWLFNRIETQILVAIASLFVAILLIAIALKIDPRCIYALCDKINMMIRGQTTVFLVNISIFL